MSESIVWQRSIAGGNLVKIKMLLVSLHGGIIVAVVCGMMAGGIDMMASEIQPAVFLVLIFTCLLGFLQPRRAWLWAFIIGSSILAVHLLGLIFSIQPACPVEPNVWVTSIALVPAFIGAYLGALTRKVLTH